jgi:methionyl-tRNA synthetase
MLQHYRENMERGSMHFDPTVIIAPPPTPNGDLHVGHLSGPYLAADVMGRFLRLRGEGTIAALSADLNQTYVVTTAEKLGEDPLALAHRSHEEVRATLTEAKIHFDVVGMPDDSYSQYVSDWFQRLYAADLIKFRYRDVPFDVLRQRFMFEAYASGFCPVCLSATKANICEACGHPNDAWDLLGLYPTGGNPNDPTEIREVAEYYIELESLRTPITTYLNNMSSEKRPALARLINELLAKPLPKFPITFPSDWGIPAGFPNGQGLVLNVWAEMLPGHYWWINNACQAQSLAPAVTAGGKTRYIQYLGFDNSFFYVFAHLGLALLARKAGIETLLPSAFVINEFYLLDNFKFSTSQGHLIWGRDLLAEVPADDVRFYLALSNPEYSQANFTRADLDHVLDHKFRKPLEQITGALIHLPRERQAKTSDYQRVMLSRFESAYGEKSQSMRLAAQTILNGFGLFIKLLKQNADPDILRGIAQAIACGLAPLSPAAAERIWQATGASGPIQWLAVDANDPAARTAVGNVQMEQMRSI